jgi:acyl-coenzyme A thioesterase PaaI-like protein
LTAGVASERDRAVAAARELGRRLSGPDVPDGVAERLEALVAELPPATSRFTEGERAAFAEGRGDIDARGTHPARGGRSPVAAGVRRIDGGLEVTFDLRHEGPPGVAHGSFVAGFFDVALGLVAIEEAGLGLTSELVVRFRRPTPLDVPVRYTGAVAERDGRVTIVEGTAVAGDVEVAAARLTFVHPRA